MKSIKIKLLIISCILANIFIVGCIYNVDYLTYFNITGRVLEKDSQFLIEGASIYFIDRGFDERREHTVDPVKICESSNNGKVNCTFEYFWGRRESWYKKKATKRFEIRISRDGYHNIILLFNGNNLESIEDVYQVKMGDVYLEKK